MAEFQQQFNKVAEGKRVLVTLTHTPLTRCWPFSRKEDVRDHLLQSQGEDPGDGPAQVRVSPFSVECAYLHTPAAGWARARTGAARQATIPGTTSSSTARPSRRSQRTPRARRRPRPSRRTTTPTRRPRTRCTHRRRPSRSGLPPWLMSKDMIRPLSLVRASVHTICAMSLTDRSSCAQYASPKWSCDHAARDRRPAAPSDRLGAWQPEHAHRWR